MKTSSEIRDLDIMIFSKAERPSMAYALRESDELFQQHGNPLNGLLLNQAQLIVIIGQAYADGQKGVA